MEYRFNASSLSFHAPVIMGILNITPDSFYAKSRMNDPSVVVERTAQMIGEGMQVLDLGAQSTRPGAQRIAEEEERSRLLPVFRKIRKAFPKLIISIDTFYPAIAKEVLEEGADIINDITGGSDEALLRLVASYKAGYVLMHIQGEPATMQKAPRYDNARAEVFSFLESGADRLRSMGIEKLILDPGFGFGKSLEHNYELLLGLNKLSRLPYPVLAGLSRKSMVTKVLDVSPEDALTGSSILHWIALSRGAKVLRVHDVRPAAEVIKLFTFTQNLELHTA